MANNSVQDVERGGASKEQSVSKVELTLKPDVEKRVKWPWLHPIKIVIYFTVLHLANLVLNLAFAARMQAKKFPVIDGLSVKTTNQYAVCYGPKPVIGLTTAASFITIAVSLCAILELKMEGKLVRPMKNLFRFRMLIYFCLSFVAFSVSIYYADCMRTDYLNWPVYDDERRVAKAALALACVGVFETLVQLGLTVVDKLYNKEIS